MTGILERIEAKLDQLLTTGQSQAAQVNAGQVAATTVYSPPAAQPLPSYLQAAPAAQLQPQAGAAVTAEQLQALIMPHIDNAAVKEALGGAMRSMGINALPETQPHQYAPLYGLFQQVLTHFGLGGAPAQPAAASII